MVPETQIQGTAPCSFRTLRESEWSEAVVYAHVDDGCTLPEDIDASVRVDCNVYATKNISPTLATLFATITLPLYGKLSLG